jgi:hypothetical protein
MNIGTQIVPLRRADIPELSQFLISGFANYATSFSHEVLLWKYFDGPNGPSEDSVCSLVARSAGRIIGHVGMCPRQLIVSGDGGTPLSTMCAFDWWSSPVHPGLGAFLMRKAFATCKTQFAVDGSAQAQVFFPSLGFEEKPRVAIFRKVLSPLHFLRSTRQGLFRKWRGAAKYVASVWRARKPLESRAVELRPASMFTEEINCLVRESSLRIVMCQREHFLLNYLLRHPHSCFSGWTIHTSQRMIGFAVLKITPHGRIQFGKIVDCWLDTEDPSCWHAAVAALIDRLRALSADDVTCYATTPNLHAALLGSGFDKLAESNVYVRDKQHLLPRDLPFGLTRFDVYGAIL